MSGINVTSVEALEEFDGAVARFAAESEAALQAVTPEINRRLELLDGRCAQCEADVEYWQQTYDYADPEEDDLSYIASRLADAEHRLNNVKSWQRRVEEVYAVYTREASQFVDHVVNDCPQAVSFVRQKLSELRDYVNLKPADSTGGVVGQDFDSLTASPSVMSSQSWSPSPGEVPLSSITELPLPSGFGWIRLNEIEPASLDALNGLKDKSGMTPEHLAEGLDILRKQILPQIKNRGAQATSDYFWQLDGQRQGLNSFQGVYDAYFGNDAIWFDRFFGQPLFRVGNGQHRIKAAQELGWPAVPARIMQPSLRRNN
jgi:hypothetical protein